MGAHVRRSAFAFIWAVLLLIPTSGSVGAAVPKCDGRPATIVGTNGNDTIKGTPGADVIVAKGGKDKVDGRGGADRICGGGGNDIIKGSRGNDRLFGDGGTDDCRQGSGTGPLVTCEAADLTVDVQGPASADENTDITYTVDVTNNGEAGVAYRVNLGFNELEGATCTGDVLGDISQPLLAPGATRSMSHVRNCVVTGEISNVSFSAHVTGPLDIEGWNNHDTQYTSLTSSP